VSRAFSKLLPPILAPSKHLERAAEKQGVLAGELFARAILKTFLLPLGLEAEELYQGECHWIESELSNLLGQELSIRAQLPSRKQIRLSPLQLRYLDAVGATEKQKQCFRLRVEYKLTPLEIARKLKCSRANVRGHLKAINEKFQKNPGKALRAYSAHDTDDSKEYGIDDLMREEQDRRGSRRLEDLK
jgi:DNA-binding CsgD family transcriptional regulator